MLNVSASISIKLKLFNVSKKLNLAPIYMFFDIWQTSMKNSIASCLICMSFERILPRRSTKISLF